jgi:hypothetical protein
LAWALQQLVRLSLSAVSSAVDIFRPDGSTTGAWSWSPPWEEDFGILLLRVGVASMEATGLRGWANEVSELTVPMSANRSAMTLHSTRQEIKYGSIHMTRAGVVKVIPGSVTTVSTIHSIPSPRSASASIAQRIGLSRFGFGRSRETQIVHHGKKKVWKGFKNEVRDVDVIGGHGGHAATAAAESQPHIVGIAGLVTFDWNWIRQLKRFCLAVVNVLFGMIRVGWNLLLGKKVRLYFPEQPGPRAEDEEDAPVDEGEELVENPEHRALYHRFLRGEEVSDDEGEEWEGSDAESSEDEGPGHEEEEEVTEAVTLYRDFMDEGAITSATVFAHMTHQGSPLTRRRYTALSNSMPLLDAPGMSILLFMVLGPYILSRTFGSCKAGSTIDSTSSSAIRRRCSAELRHMHL